MTNEELIERSHWGGEYLDAALDAVGENAFAYIVMQDEVLMRHVDGRSLIFPDQVVISAAAILNALEPHRPDGPPPIVSRADMVEFDATSTFNASYLPYRPVTVQDAIELLGQGVPGEPGLIGPPGPEGPPGADGADGADGQPGQDGAPGADGQDGADGADGQPGQDSVVPGPPGEPGDDGSPGDTGEDGKGWTGGSYNGSTGQVTFTSDDGLAFQTDDLRGDTGAGVPGPGVPPGGDVGQIILKAGPGDYETIWYTANTGGSDSGLPPGGLPSQMLYKTSEVDFEASWAYPPPSVPGGGDTGQVLTKASDDSYNILWADPTGGGGGKHVVTGDPLSPPANWAEGQLLWDGVPADDGSTFAADLAAERSERIAADIAGGQMSSQQVSAEQQARVAADIAEHAYAESAFGEVDSALTDLSERVESLSSAGSGVDVDADYRWSGDHEFTEGEVQFNNYYGPVTFDGSKSDYSGASEKAFMRFVQNANSSGFTTFGPTRDYWEQRWTLGQATMTFAQTETSSPAVKIDKYGLKVNGSSVTRNATLLDAVRSAENFDELKAKLIAALEIEEEDSDGALS